MKHAGILVLVCVISSVYCTVNADFTSFDKKISILSRDINDTLQKEQIIKSDGPIIEHLKHRRFIPFARPLQDDNSSNCTSSEDDFPAFILDDDQVKHGGVILCILIGIYCFTLLARVCNDYFIPCVETICEILNLSPDVTAATFMSIATSTPELFTNLIGTFITESDIGIGTIFGSSMFNGLGVGGIGGLAAPCVLQLDWWPLTRDVSIYTVCICMLVTITWDGVIYWYEATILFITYFIYFTIMFQNDRISRFVRSRIGRNKKNLQDVVLEPPSEKEEVPRISVLSVYGTYIDHSDNPVYEQQRRLTLEKLQKQEIADARRPLFKWPTGTKLGKFVFFYTWPIQLVLRYTIPSSRLYPKLFPLTFMMCIVWIGANSYMVSWMITILGNLLNLPDSVMGMMFLSVGGCLPECISMIIIARRGEGAFGVSNSLGANSMNILFSLGMPWFFKNMVDGATTAHPIRIVSGTIEYSIMALILVAFTLYVVLATNKFRLSKITGAMLVTAYLIFDVLAILSETVFFDHKKC